jgi:hypothetical protein
MERLGLVRDVRVPAAERIEAKRRDRVSRPVGTADED